MENLQINFNKLSHYCAVGFDVDHCLVRYKAQALTRLCYHSIMTTLVEKKNYPQELLNNDLTEDEMAIGLNFCVIDTKLGNILKIGENKIILRGFHGLSLKLGYEDLSRIYGNNNVLEDYDPVSVRKDSDYFTCSTFFENSIAIMFAKVVEYFEVVVVGERKNKEKSPENTQSSQSSEMQNYQEDQENNERSKFPKILGEAEYKTIMNDIFYGLRENYRHFDETRCYPIRTHGNFFKNIVENPEKYIYKQDAFKEILLKLRKQGQFLFIATNSHYEFLETTMSYAYGEQWKDLFDIIVCKSGKPSFFSDVNLPFYKLNLEADTLKGEKLNDIENQGKIFLEGNYSILEQYIRQQKPRSTAQKLLYFGDNILTDCYYCQKLPTWDAICVLEELHEDQKRMKVIDHELPSYNKLWGSFFNDEYLGAQVETFWYNLIKTSVSNVTRLLVSEEIVSFWAIEDQIFQNQSQTCQ